jgi:hypothetical protein
MWDEDHLCRLIEDGVMKMCGVEMKKKAEEWK